MVGERFGQVLDGIWIPLGRVGPKDVTDGLSKTYLWGEKYIQPRFYESVNMTRNVNPDDSVWGDSILTYVRYAHHQVFKERDVGCLEMCHGFSSAHPGSWNVCMADGSVSSQTYGISPLVHQAFGTIAESDRTIFEE